MPELEHVLTQIQDTYLVDGERVKVDRINGPYPDWYLELGEQDPEPEPTTAAVEHAAAQGVDIDKVEGTGQDGRVTAPDVDAAAQENAE